MSANPPTPPPKKSMLGNIASPFKNIGNRLKTVASSANKGLSAAISNINYENVKNATKTSAKNTLESAKNGLDTATSVSTELVTTIPYDLAYNIPKTAVTTLFNDFTKSSQHTFSLDIFEKRFKLFGKTLDKYMEEIAFDQNTKKSGVTDNDHIVVKNEILTVFQKSKLNPNQLAALIMTNNIYIENEKPGDWTRLQVQEVEEEMYNMRHEPGYIDKDKEDKYKDPIEYNRDPNEQSFVYNKKIKQNFD